MGARLSPACISVIAGTNGAGKSSVAGATLRADGGGYFDPDEAARQILAAGPGITQEDANSAAWHQGKRLLERSIAERISLTIETTLGGRTITTLLGSTLAAGLEVRIWYVGLESAELHIARVKARVAKGGHAIPEERIRERFDRSRLNLIHLMPRLTELSVFDNSAEADPLKGIAPTPALLLHMVHGRIVRSCNPAKTPQWAKPIMAAALVPRRTPIE
jgi:predicted ABC-type ATPase